MMLGGRFGACRLGIGLVSRMGFGLGLSGDDCVCVRERQRGLSCPRVIPICYVYFICLTVGQENNNVVSYDINVNQCLCACRIFLNKIHQMSFPYLYFLLHHIDNMQKPFTRKKLKKNEMYIYGL